MLIIEVNDKRTDSSAIKNFAFVSTDLHNANTGDDLSDTQPLDYGDFFDDEGSPKGDTTNGKVSVINVEVLGKY